jgi:palmitoyl transferase
MWNIGSSPDWKYGVGATVFIMSRQDIMNYIPFPGVLPIASISYKDLSIQTAYVPGGQNVGNVLFTWAKYNLP